MVRSVKTPSALVFSAIALFAFQAVGQDVADLLSEAQRAYIRGDMTEAKKKFELVLKVEPENRTATAYVRRIAAEEAKAGPNRANSMQASLEKLILPKVNFQEASLPEVLEFLRQKASQVGEGKVAVSFVMKLDETAKNAKVTLNLQDVPFSEVLRYIGELANVEFSYEPYAIVVKPKGAAPNAPGAQKTEGI